MQNRLPREFFEQPTLEVARALLGKQLVFNNKRGIITETEAYIGQDDPACHAAKGCTKRTSVMFGKAGFSYIFLIYGMYHCLNFVTEKEQFPAAVLIRAVTLPDDIKFNGPGKVCRYFGIDLQHNAIDITKSNDFYLADHNQTLQYKVTSRIGISKGQDRLWRFVVHQ